MINIAFSTETNVEEIVVSFEETLTADGKAAKTLKSYIGYIRKLLQLLESKGDIFTGNLK